MARPFAYMRKSYVRDPENEMAPETQEREVRTLAERFNDVIDADAMLSDWDVSGRREFTQKRQGYLRLVEAIEYGEVTAVYSYSLARLGRSTQDLSKLFDLCAAQKVPIRLVVDNVDTSTASGRMTANILASVAQFEAEVAGERLRAMYETKRARAEKEGTDPRDAVRTSRRYGETKTYVDPDGTTRSVGEGDDPDLVLQVFHEEGSYTRAARRLNEMGVKPRSSSKWWASSVAAVVERIDPELALRPRAPRKPRTIDGRGFTLAKLLRCPLDGSTLSGSHIPDKKGKRWTRYSCRHAEATPHPRVSIAEHLILPAVLDEFALYYNPDETRATGDAEARRADLTERRQRTIESRIDGLLTRTEAVRRVADIDAELAVMSVPPRPPKRVKLWGGLDERERNQVLRDVFDHVVLDAETFRPVGFVWRDPSWRSPDPA
jgi:DNA invertase Pin-like site-specific DNA recombinase